MTAPDYPGCPATVGEAIAAGRVLRPARWGLADVAIMALGTLAVAFLAGAALGWLRLPFGAETVLGVMAPWLMLGGWPLLATRLRGNGASIDLGLRMTWAEAAWGAVAGVACLIVAAIAAVLTGLIVGDFGSAAGEVAEQLVARGDPLTWLAFGLLLALGAPIVEELAFRGLTFAALRKRGLGPTATVVLSALAFAAFHFEPVRLPVLLAVGLVLGFTRLRTGALGACIVAHAVNNLPGAVFVVLGLPGTTP